MDKHIQNRNTEVGTFFSLKDGSNYKILMTYDRSEVVEFEQFRKIAQLLNDSEYKFLTINQRIVNKSTIIDVCPTEEKTEKQKENTRNNPIELVVDDGKGNPVRMSEIVSS